MMWRRYVTCDGGSDAEPVHNLKNSENIINGYRYKTSVWNAVAVTNKPQVV